MDITDLPHDVFLLIVAHLSARTAVLCRRVSRRWQAAFAGQDLSLRLLRWHFPRCREVRLAHAAAGVGGEVPGGPGGTGGLSGHARRTAETPGGAAGEDDGDDGDYGGRATPDWTAVFAAVARRYHHLGTATPRSVDKVRLGTTGPGQDRFRGVATWDRHLRLNDRTAPFHHPDPSWCYGGQDGGDSGGHGLLVYHRRAPRHPDDDDDDDDDEGGDVATAAPARAHVYPWRLLDLGSGEEVEVPFPHDDDRIVRRVRLTDGVLAFEWCERTAYHQLNDREECHRHYVTVLDVARTAPTHASNTASTASTTTTATTTTTSSTTAAANDAAWEITPRAEFKFHFLGLPLNAHDRFLSAHTRTHYAVYVWQPNRSPWGEDDPIESAIVWDTTRSPPRVVRRMAWAALAFYGARQGAAPRLRCLGLDDRNLYLVEEEHRWERGAQGSPSPPRVHLVRSTGIPVVPAPTEGQGEGEGEGEGEVVVQGPRWLDECGANGDVNLSFCSRAAGNTTNPQPAAARWAGWAPCWRHEEFPYLTVGEAVDFQAGVRVAARRCFMLETLSVHVRPSLSVRGVLGVGGDRVGGDASSSARASPSLDGREGGKEVASGGGEVEFPDEMWDELLGAGCIFGDERWLVGEDGEGRVTIVRF